MAPLGRAVVKDGLERLGLHFSSSRNVLALIAFALGLAVPSTLHQEVPAQLGPYVEEVAPAEALEEWTVDAGVPLAAFSALSLAGLPPPLPHQRTAEECDPDLAQEPINGGCWVKTEKTPPCPKGKLHPHEGRCWIRVLRAARPPTSGGGYPTPVAEPH